MKDKNKTEIKVGDKVRLHGTYFPNRKEYFSTFFNSGIVTVTKVNDHTCEVDVSVCDKYCKWSKTSHICIVHTQQEIEKLSSIKTILDKI